jgi:hypothetical protein
MRRDRKIAASLVVSMDGWMKVGFLINAMPKMVHH